MEIVGELKEQIKGQLQSLTVVVTSVLAIYLALVFQFNNAIKPLIVFVGIPFGAVGALGGVWIMNMPMGFMVILGITSLIGIIVSHVIVLFDFIEDRHEQGKPLGEALIDAGILRIRPVLITVGATVAGSVSLGAARWPALGGPLLRANRRINGGHHRDFVYCPNLVLDLCPRFENHSLGGTRTGGGKG